tara:strand:- start:944 stop:1195 length:252 start_codon:yes stop_codon:yes gene_type:complete
MDLEFKNSENIKCQKWSFYQIFSKYKGSHKKRYSNENKYIQIEKLNEYLQLRIKELEIDKKYLQESYNLLLLKYQIVHEFAFE